MDDTQDRYIEIVAANWTAGEYNVLARLIRAHWFSVIWKADGPPGIKFTGIWLRTFTIAEEITLAGEATLMDKRA